MQALIQAAQLAHSLAVIGALVRSHVPRTDVVVDRAGVLALDQSVFPTRGFRCVSGSLKVKGSLSVVAPLIVCGDLLVVQRQRARDRGNGPCGVHAVGRSRDRGCGLRRAAPAAAVRVEHARPLRSRRREPHGSAAEGDACRGVERRPPRPRRPRLNAIFSRQFVGLAFDCH